MKFLVLEEVDSTNSYVARHADELEDFTMVIADVQAAGRGQRGNSWESQPGANLTATLLFRPSDLKPSLQFAVSEAVAITVADYLRDEGINASVKWPNDIYVGDRKIAGILIEHSVTSYAIAHSRIGIGLNVNQTLFLSDAPNPVSMAIITGVERNVSRVAAALAENLRRCLSMTESEEGRSRLHNSFLSYLWRNDGAPHPFRRKADNSLFNGIIDSVDPSGQINILDTGTGRLESFWFKEVEFVISKS